MTLNLGFSDHMKWPLLFGILFVFSFAWVSCTFLWFAYEFENEMPFATCFTQAKHKNSFASRNKTTLQNKWWGKVFTSAEYTCICSHSRHTIRKSKKDNLRSSNRVAIAWLSPRLICNLHCTMRVYATHFADVSWLRGTEMPRPSSSMAAPLMMLPLGVLRLWMLWIL